MGGRGASSSKGKGSAGGAGGAVAESAQTTAVVAQSTPQDAVKQVEADYLVRENAILQRIESAENSLKNREQALKQAKDFAEKAKLKQEIKGNKQAIKDITSELWDTRRAKGQAMREAGLKARATASGFGDFANKNFNMQTKGAVNFAADKAKESPNGVFQTSKLTTPFGAKLKPTIDSDVMYIKKGNDYFRVESDGADLRSRFIRDNYDYQGTFKITHQRTPTQINSAKDWFNTAKERILNLDELGN
jgi:hypothetical protein